MKGHERRSPTADAGGGEVPVLPPVCALPVLVGESARKPLPGRDNECDERDGDGL
jgi:hypothetical protein